MCQRISEQHKDVIPLGMADRELIMMRVPRDLWCAANEHCGRAGMQMGEWSVHEVRVVQATCTVTFAGPPQQRRE